MAVSNYQSPGNFKALASCYFRQVDNRTVVASAPSLDFIHLDDPPEIMVQEVDQGVEPWEVDFIPSGRNTRILFREFSVFGGQNAAVVARFENRIQRCGGTAQRIQ